MISCWEICKLYFWCNDITLFSPYDFYNALKSTFATDVVGCLCQLEASNFGFDPAPKITGPALVLPFQLQLLCLFGMNWNWRARCLLLCPSWIPASPATMMSPSCSSTCIAYFPCYFVCAMKLLVNCFEYHNQTIIMKSVCLDNQIHLTFLVALHIVMQHVLRFQWDHFSYTFSLHAASFCAAFLCWWQPMNQSFQKP